jgi:hypothetical protein
VSKAEVNERWSAFDPLQWTPPSGPLDAFAAVLAIALFVVPWLLIGWWIWVSV